MPPRAALCCVARPRPKLEAPASRCTRLPSICILLQHPAAWPWLPAMASRHTGDYADAAYARGFRHFCVFSLPVHGPRAKMQARSRLLCRNTR